MCGKFVFLLALSCLLHYATSANVVVKNATMSAAPPRPLTPAPKAVAKAVSQAVPKELSQAVPKVVPASSKPSCPAEASCIVTADTEPACVYDDVAGCIRKYPSKCHLYIAGCKKGIEYKDYGNIYCSMETFLCEEGYERWTIFFGYEKD